MTSSVKSVILGTVLLAGCGPTARPTPPPPIVVIGKPVVRDVRAYLDVVGTTEAADSVEIRARVTGFLQSSHFAAGSDVEVGQLLFTIEPGQFEAAVEGARAALAIAQAECERAKADLARVEEAVKTRAVSEMEVDLRRADRDKAEAAVRSEQARLRAAELDLGYTRITSPLAGRISRSLESVGNLVGPGGPTSLLATVVAMKPLRVYFPIPERMVVQRLRELRASDSAAAPTGARVHLRMQLEGETDYPHEGYIDYTESEVDPATGALRVRGSFANEDLRIVPGMFARIRILAEEVASAVLVEETAIGTDLGGKFVMVVGAGNIVERRYVQLGVVDQGHRVVRSGLDPDTTYVVEGTVKARPGQPVTPLTREQVAAARQAPNGSQGR